MGGTALSQVTSRYTIHDFGKGTVVIQSGTDTNGTKRFSADDPAGLLTGRSIGDRVRLCVEHNTGRPRVVAVVPG